MRTNMEIKRLVRQLDKQANVHRRKIDIIKRIKRLIKATASHTTAVKKENEP